MLVKVSQNEKSLDRSHRTVWSDPAGAPRGRRRRKCWRERGLRQELSKFWIKKTLAARPKAPYPAGLEIAALINREWRIMNGECQSVRGCIRAIRNFQVVQRWSRRASAAAALGCGGFGLKRTN